MENTISPDNITSLWNASLTVATPWSTPRIMPAPRPLSPTRTNGRTSTRRPPRIGFRPLETADEIAKALRERAEATKAAVAEAEAAAAVAEAVSEAVEARKGELLEEFEPVTPANMARVWEFLRQEKGRTTDFSYGGMLMWVNYFNYEFAIVNNTLFIRGLVENDRSKPAFSLPVGALPLEQSVPMVCEYCRRHGIRAEFSAVPEYALAELQALNPSAVEELGDWGDYLYNASDLSTLKGKKFGKKRNHVNKFDSLYADWSLETMTPENAPEAMRFMDVFDLEGDDTPMAADERALTRELIGELQAGDTNLLGALLKVDGKVAAFTIGDIKGDTLFVHVEKATRTVEGSYEKINKEFAAKVCAEHPEVAYINREDDAGDPGLRLAKESYHPVEKLKKFNVIFE